MNINGISNNILSQTINGNISSANSKAQSVETDKFKKMLEDAQVKQDDAQLRKACQQFEEMFVRMMMKNMRRTVEDSGLVENSFARNTYQEMLDSEMAKESSKGSGIGIAQVMYDRLKDTI